MCPGMPQGCVLSPLHSLHHGLASHLLLRQHASSPGGTWRSSWATGGPRGMRDTPLPPSLFHGKLSVSTASSYLVAECGSSGKEGLKEPPLPQEAEICWTLRSWQSPWETAARLSATVRCSTCAARQKGLSGHTSGDCGNHSIKYQLDPEEDFFLLELWAPHEDYVTSDSDMSKHAGRRVGAKLDLD